MVAVAVHVVPLDQPAAVVTALEPLLDDDERERQGALRGRDAVRRFVVSHGAQREVLGALLGVEAGAVRLVRRCAVCGGAHGKPGLAGGRPRFGLAHSGELALVAVADVEVGVDVEVVRPRPHLEALARRVLTAEERRDWEAFGDEERLPAFYAAWTVKEAFLKGLGVGLHRPPATVTCSALDPPWSWRSVDVGPGHAAAVAAAAPTIVVSTRPWEPARPGRTGGRGS